MQARHTQVGLDPHLHAGRLDEHSGLVGHGQVGGAGGQDAHARVYRYGGESRLRDPGGVAVTGDLHSRFARRRPEGCPVLVRHPADQALALPLGDGHGEVRCVGGRLARREHDLGNATAQPAAKVQARAAAQLLELDRAQLDDGLFLGQLARDQAAEDVLHKPASI